LECQGVAGSRAEAVEDRDVQISSDPRFEEKLVDVVGLYLDPPAKAVVFSFDERVRHEAP
jgi:hypothetical protein